MTTYRCPNCAELHTMTGPEWQAHRLADLATHRGPSRFSNDPSRPAQPEWIRRQLARQLPATHYAR